MIQNEEIALRGSLFFVSGLSLEIYRDSYYHGQNGGNYFRKRKGCEQIEFTKTHTNLLGRAGPLCAAAVGAAGRSGCTGFQH